MSIHHDPAILLACVSYDLKDNVGIEGSGKPKSLYKACNAFLEGGASTHAIWPIGQLLTDDPVTKNNDRT